MKTYAYARVSARDQNLTRQIESFLEFGIERKFIYSDKKSGKDFERKGYDRMLKKLRAGDLVVIKSIDRLGRCYAEIQEQWRCLTREKCVHIVVLDMPLLDTRTRGGNLTGTFVADLVLQILCYVAQVERENIRQRQAEGIAAAKARGVKFGREKKPIPDRFYDLWARFQRREITVRAAAQELGVVHSTFLKWGGMVEKSL